MFYGLELNRLISLSLAIVDAVNVVILRQKTQLEKKYTDGPGFQEFEPESPPYFYTVTLPSVMGKNKLH